MGQPNKKVTELLHDYRTGDASALEALLPQVYDEMRKLAAAYMRKEKANHTLQPTALVHEAFLRLVDQRSVQWQNRSHFFGVAAQLMRRLLTDHARAKKAEKRGGKEVVISLEDLNVPAREMNPDVLELDEALTELAKIEPVQAKIVELRYFGGLSIEETAEAVELSPATVKRYWTLAKTWLERNLRKD